MIFGKIDYINLLPFHIFLKRSSLNNALKKAIEHKKGVPTLINKEFHNRKVSAAFISSIKSNAKNIKALPLGIVAKKQVKSVIVKKGKCKNDPASATSNILCKVLNIQGEVFIGDIALKKYIKKPDDFVDLAELWYKKYNLPFVFAVLCTNKHHTIYKKLANKFKNKNIKIPNYILKDYAQKRGITTKEIKEYLKLISYNIDNKGKKALKLFLKKASRIKKSMCKKHYKKENKMAAQHRIEEVLQSTIYSTPGQAEFYQAVDEVLQSLEPLLQKEHKYTDNNILSRIVIPERQIIFRVCWMDDKNVIQTNIGYRVQFNSAIGPYKGGLRLHPTVNLGIIKFLGFEQIFKNSLTGLNIGGAKGGSNFDPKGKSDGEVMRFCQSFMTELSKYIGETIDVPAGDIGTGGREIGYMFGQYKKLTNRFEGVLTGKGLNWGGSLARTEATGFGSVYFADNFLRKVGNGLEGKVVTISGSGNVAIYTIQKIYELGAKPVTCSDSRGTIYHKDGINLETLHLVKETNRASLTEYAKAHPDAQYIPVSEYPKDAHAVWAVPCDLAFPSATQNELNINDAKTLVKNGCLLVNEGANMPTTPEAIEYLMANKVLYAPGKAANAGGVATSQLEMEQNASMGSWSFSQVDTKLQGIMKDIFDLSFETAEEFGKTNNIMMGANIAGFRKVADSMLDQGAV